MEYLTLTDGKLPIRHFTIGEGNKNIVIIGGMHGCEIITTDFILKLINEFLEQDQIFTLLKENKYKLHFIPLLNPEGYLITTTAIRKILSKIMSLNKAEKICKEYYTNYKQDDINENTKKVIIYNQIIHLSNYTKRCLKMYLTKTSQINIYLLKIN